MKIGVTIHATDLTIAVHDLAVAAEERGFHSLYVPEHTHIPVSRETPPPTGGDELEEKYLRTPDPIVALAAAAAVTSRILLGTAVTLPAQHDPIAWAKAIATLDQISDGRVVLGVGLRLERGGDADPRRRLRRAAGDRARAHAPQPGALARRHRIVRGRAHHAAAELVVAQAGAAVPACAPCSAAERGRSCSPTSPSGATAGSPSVAVGSRSRCRSSGTFVAAAGRDPDTLHIVPMGVLPTDGEAGVLRDARRHRDGAAAAGRRPSRGAVDPRRVRRVPLTPQAGSTDSHVASAAERRMASIVGLHGHAVGEGGGHRIGGDLAAEDPVAHHLVDPRVRARGRCPSSATCRRPCAAGRRAADRAVRARGRRGSRGRGDRRRCRPTPPRPAATPCRRCR